MAGAARNVEMGDDRWISCEDDLDIVLGVFNFWATLTSVVLLSVPLGVLWEVVRQRGPAVLHAWAIALLLLFLHNLWQHAVGPPSIDLDTVGRLHDMPLVLVLLRNRLGGRLPTEATVSALAAAALLMAICVFAPAWQAHADGALLLVCAPCVVYECVCCTKGRPRARLLLKRALVGFVLANVFVALERKLCEQLPFPQLQHAIVGHAIIFVFLGSLAQLVLEVSLPKADLAGKKGEQLRAGRPVHVTNMN